MNVDASERQFERYEDVREFYGPEGPSLVTTEERAKVAFALILDATTFAEISVQLNAVEGDFGGIVLNTHPQRAID